MFHDFNRGGRSIEVVAMEHIVVDEREAALIEQAGKSVQVLNSVIQMTITNQRG